MSDLPHPRPSHPGAVVVGGVGEGFGLAIATRFTTGGHPVIMLARSADRLAEFEKRLPRPAAWRTAASPMSVTNSV
jgi:NADP-dependent 3-hydroxy acid dehydrogenase YdfG